MTSGFAVPEEMKIQYLRRKVEELAASKEHIANQNFDSVTTLAHQMKGNAVTFEFPLLAPLAAALENAAMNKNAFQAKESLEDIQKAVDGMLRRLLKNQK